MKPNDMPLVCLPLGLCDEDAATLLQVLYDLTEALESHYSGQLLRRNHQLRERQQTSPHDDLNDPAGPPF